MKHLFTLLLFITSFYLTSAQITQSKRYEVPFKYSEENYLISTNGEYGIVLFRESKERVPKKEVWEVKVLDTSLTEVHQLNVEVEYKYDIIGFQSYENSLFLLFKNADTYKSDFLLVNIDLTTGLYKENQFANDMVIDASHLEINDKRVVLGGYINYRPTFVVFDYINDKLNVVPGFFALKSEILDFNYDGDNDSYNVLMGQKNAINRNELAIKSFSGLGKVLVDYKYEFEDNWRALNGKMRLSKDEKIIIAGSYANNNSYYSMGYYFGSLAPGSDIEFEYITFTEVGSFFDYMRPNRAEKIKRKIDESKDRNKPYEFKAQVFVHELNDLGGKYSVMSELYKPEFTGGSEGNMALRHNNEYRDKTAQKYVHRSSKLTNTDGASHISYYEAVYLEIDQKGKLTRDLSMALDDAETLSLEQIAQASTSGEQAVLFYKLENELKSKVFMADTVWVKSDTIQTMAAHDEILSQNEKQGRVQHWYDNHYIVWGYQKINNNQSGLKEEKRNVFYVNKIDVEW